MRRLMYVSSAARNTSPSDLQAILEGARRRNSAAGITGMLLYMDGGFLQVLEGPDNAVAATFERIKKDERHTGCRVLIDERVNERLFGGWSMGFDKLNGGPASADVFRITRDAIVNSVPREKARAIATFLHTFYNVSSNGRAA